MRRPGNKARLYSLILLKVCGYSLVRQYVTICMLYSDLDGARVGLGLV